MLHPQRNEAAVSVQKGVAGSIHLLKDQKGLPNKNRLYSPSQSQFAQGISQSNAFCISKYVRRSRFGYRIYKENRQRIFRFYLERFGTGLQNLGAYPKPGLALYKKVAPSTHLEKDQKGLPMTMKAFHPSKSIQILVYPENFTVHAFWVSEKPEMFKETALDKNLDRENHERTFRFYGHRFGTSLLNVDGWPQIW